VPARYADRRAQLPDPDAALAWSRAHQAECLAALQPRIVPATVQGCLQIFGGLNAGGSMELQLGAVLPPGRTLAVTAAPMDGRPDLYPLDVDVFVEERRVGALRVAAAGESSARFPLSSAQASAAFEVRLAARDWAVFTVRGHSGVASVRLVELASLSE